jgi:hypothetical protein
MAHAFHTIWLGGCPPLRALENLIHLLLLFERELPQWHQQPSEQQAPVPLLWLDQSAWDLLIEQAPLDVHPCSSHTIPERWQHCLTALLGESMVVCRWLQFEHTRGPLHLPVLVVEQMLTALSEPWASIQPALKLLKQQRLPSLSDPAAASLLNGPALLAYLRSLIAHAQQHWARHGLLCLASDLLRLLALSWRPGVYGDLGDVTGRLQRLPSVADAGSAGFCAHHTVAVENDLIITTNANIVQAITLATALWSWGTVRGIAQRLVLDHPTPSSDPNELLQAVLPQLDQRLPSPPSLTELLQAPWTQLADFINLAYGATPVFHPATHLNRYSAGRRGKELLINDVGGFSGYQHAAHRLVPTNAEAWLACADRYGLSDYAPQLGWKTYGYGAIDRLIDLGQRLNSTPKRAESARADLALIALSLSISAKQLEPVASLSAQLHTLLSNAHHQPQQRSHWLGQVELLCKAFAATG